MHHNLARTHLNNVSVNTDVMPIPNDSLGRYWIDVSADNPKFVNELRPCLVGFLAFDYEQRPELAGTGFVIGENTDFALVISAKHVLSEGVLKIQRPVPRHSPSALFVPVSSRTPILHEAKLRAIWMGSESADLLYTRHFSYNDSLDIACCIFSPQESYATQFKPISIPLDTTRPSVGDVVHMVSQGGMNISNRSPPTDVTGSGQTFWAHRRVSVRIGTVTAIYPRGFRQYRWPCFTTSIPADPGMSGGFVYLPRDGRTIAACGVVCADNSSFEARTNYLLCGESVIACAWPALSLHVPKYYASDSPMCTLHEMMKAGAIPTAVGGIDHIEVVDLGNGDGRVTYRDI